MYKLIQEQEHHDKAKIYFFCLNSQCKFKRNGCQYCAYENHKSHLQDCFMMNSIQQILENETYKLKKLLARLNDFLKQIRDYGQKILNQILQFTKLLDQNDFSEIDQTIISPYNYMIIQSWIKGDMFFKLLFVSMNNNYGNNLNLYILKIQNNTKLSYAKLMYIFYYHNNKGYFLLIKYKQIRLLFFSIKYIYIYTQSQLNRISNNQVESSIEIMSKQLKFQKNVRFKLIQDFRKIDCNVVSPADMLKQTIQRKLLCFKTNFDSLSEQKIINFILKILNIRKCNSENEIKKLWNYYSNYYKECLLNDDQNVQDNLEFSKIKF